MSQNSAPAMGMNQQSMSHAKPANPKRPVTVSQNRCQRSVREG